MSDFTFKELGINGVFEIKPFLFEDERGYFMKDFEKEIFAAAGIEMNISEVEESYSHKGVLRGLHFQTVDSQAKLVRVVMGEVYDVAVDLRRNSPTYKKWVGIFLSGEKKNLLYIPSGFAHGFLVMSDEAYFTYKCAGKYHKEADGGINWRDKEINVSWPLERIDNLLLSAKDEKLPMLCEIEDKLNF